jgi:DNA-binding CsgD family transcriptional regulator
MTLTPKQKQILEMAVQGNTLKSIGLELNLTPQAINSHLARAREANDVVSTLQLVVKAIFEGVLYPAKTGFENPLMAGYKKAS